jgi:hypothetical protein
MTLGDDSIWATECGRSLQRTYILRAGSDRRPHGPVALT